MKQPSNNSVITNVISPAGLRHFTRRVIAVVLVAGPCSLELATAEPLMHVAADTQTGQCVIREGETNVLQYNHQAVQPPPGVLEKITTGNQKYARTRSDYIHPLYGPSGEILTMDWAIDHPHHRGIYWAWPEVMLDGRTSDLHALQQVFARPVGKPVSSDGDEAATIEAENNWMWEDKTPIVREKVKIRAEKLGSHGRRIDLTITLSALVEGVSIARRETDKYGGLNTRCAAAKSLAITHHADPEGTDPRIAWHQATGTWGSAAKPAGVTIFENAENPGYPADHIEYPDLAWFQPAFPRAGTRHPLKKGEPLVLRFRYLIRSGDAVDQDTLRQEWKLFNKFQPVSKP